MMNKASLRCFNGFTLLEVMVALVIIAITLGAIVEGNTASIRNAQHLKNKTIALLIANNQLVTTRIGKSWPRVSQTTGEETSANQEWYWKQKVIKTDDPLLRRIDIDVSLNDDRDYVLYHLTGFMAAP